MTFPLLVAGLILLVGGWITPVGWLLTIIGGVGLFLQLVIFSALAWAGTKY
jgi:hypothetical protein